MVGTRHNQVLLDSSQRQLAEIDLFEKGYLVSAPSLELMSKLTNEQLYETSIKKLPIEEKRKVFRKINDNIQKIYYSIIAKKFRPKNEIEQSYKKIK